MKSPLPASNSSLPGALSASFFTSLRESDRVERTMLNLAARQSMQIEGKRVLVSGASRGLGRTLAFAFANAGAKEVLAGTRKEDDRNSLRTDAANFGANIRPVQLDVTSDEDVSSIAQLGTVDILVNNAGVAGYGNPLTMNFANAQEEIEVNYLGTLRMVRAFAPMMIEQRQGAIVNIATAF